MALRDEKQVPTGHGKRVHERHHMLGLVDDLGRAIARGDATERAYTGVVTEHLGQYVGCGLADRSFRTRMSCWLARPVHHAFLVGCALRTT